MREESRSQQLANLKLALAVPAVQLDALDVRRSANFPTAPDEPSDASSTTSILPSGRFWR